MKKFKVKNRQKRKYVRRTVKDTGSSFAHTLPIGILPMLLIVLALIMNAFISTKAIDQSLSTLVLPKISLPTIFLPQIHFALPPLGENLNGIVQLLSLPVYALLSAITSFTQSLMNFFTHLTPTTHTHMRLNENGGLVIPLWHLLMQILFNTVNLIQAAAIGTNTGLQAIVKLMIQGIAATLADMQWFVMNTIQTIGAAIINGFTILTHTIQFLLQMTVHAIQISASAIWWLIQFVFHVTTDFLSMIWINIVHTIKTIVYYIELPFRILWSYIAATKPFFIAFGKLIGQSTNELVGGFKNLGLVTSEVYQR